MYVYDSRNVKKGDVFLCLPGGESYCNEALRRGASAIKRVTRKEMAVLANSFYSFPSKDLVVIGVTGTNGKTSVCYFVSHALDMLGNVSFFQGTITHDLTTPESLDTIQSMRDHCNRGGTHFVMEVSSHGISQDRVFGLEFDIVCLTNISQDHLDFHGSMEVYKQVKMGFMEAAQGVSIYPDDFQELLIEDDSSQFPYFDVLNRQAAFAILIACGFEQEQVQAVLKRIKPPKGRYEMVESKAPFHVMVDYAHSPNGIEGLLSSVRKQVSSNKGRILVCYGCGGDRDRLKRPLMASVVSRLSDYSVITMDNPRTEDPAHIIDDMKPGICEGHMYDIELDRKKAIAHICLQARKYDRVLLIGKGHEQHQYIGKHSYPFSDVDVVKEVLAGMGY